MNETIPLSQASFYVFIAVLGLILALCWIFRDRIRQQEARTIDRLRNVLDQGVDIENHAASYTTKKYTPDGHIIQEEEFQCRGSSLTESIDGIIFLRDLSKGNYDIPSKSKNQTKENIPGVG